MAELLVDIFSETRRLVTTREVAELNDLHPNPGGFICCPFHDEQTPSLKLYRDGGWKCFGCGKGGSVIDFTCELYGLSPLEAVRQLNRDFRLGLPLDSPPDRAAIRQRQETSNAYELFEQWRVGLLQQVTAAHRVAHEAIQRISSPADFDSLSAQEVEAVHWMDYHAYLADALAHGDPEEQKILFRERRVIQLRINRILQRSSPRKSGAA